MSKTVRSALAIIPPSELFAPINAIRKDHDAAYVRWMPHINVLYPFVPEESFTDAAEHIRAVLDTVCPFEVSLDSVGEFKRGKSLLWLKPKCNGGGDKEIQELYSKVKSLFPHCVDLDKENGYTPHLTLGQFQSTRVPNMKRSLDATFGGPKPIVTWTCDKVHLIARQGDEPFRVVCTVPLGGGAGAGGGMKTLTTTTTSDPSAQHNNTETEERNAPEEEEGCDNDNVVVASPLQQPQPTDIEGAVSHFVDWVQRMMLDDPSKVPSTLSELRTCIFANAMMTSASKKKQKKPRLQCDYAAPASSSKSNMATSFPFSEQDVVDMLLAKGLVTLPGGSSCDDDVPIIIMC
eukprot:PhM_4_TR10887/c0_g1_i1/m.75452